MSQETTQAPVHPNNLPRTLFKHTAHLHQPRNVNRVHEEEKAASSFNQKIAIGLTKGVGTMVCAYAFSILALIGFPGLFLSASQYIQWISQTFIQLVMLSVIMVGQAVLGRKAELQSEEQYNTTIKTYHDIEQIMQHLSAQDEELLRHTHMIVHLLVAAGIPAEKLAEIGITPEQLATLQSNGSVAATNSETVQ